MDDTVTERRAEARVPREVLTRPQATLRPGCPVDVIDVSPQGIQVQSTRPLRPGSRVLVRLVVADRTTTVPAVVLRCTVWTIDPEEGLTYRGGLRFEEVCPAVWEEHVHGSALLHAPP